MKLGVRGKLFVTSLLLLTTTWLIGGLYLQRRLRAHLQEDLASSLRARGAALVALLGRTNPADMDSFADRYGEALGVHILLAQDGTIVGDSLASASDLPALKVELQQNEFTKVSIDTVSERYDPRLLGEMAFVVLEIPRDTSKAVVMRVGISSSSIRDAVREFRRMLFATGLVALATAAILSGLAAHWSSRSLRQLVAKARAGSQLPMTGVDEVRYLAGSFNKLLVDAEAAITSLTEERDRLYTLLEGMSEAVIAVDSQDRVTLANAAAEAMFATDVWELRPLAEVSRAPAVSELVQECRRVGKANADFVLTHPRERAVLGRARMLSATGGVVMVMLDVSEVKRLETIRRDFVANVSHELRTPIAVMRANAETLQAGALRDERRAAQFLDAIVRNAEKLGTLLSELLELARVESGKYRPQRETVDVEYCVSEAVTELQPQADRRGVTIALELEVLEVRGDSLALQRVLTNLLENAIKYGRENGHVKIASIAEGSECVIAVSDDGPGIDPRYQARIFERFFRVERDRARDPGGTGLGLAISKHLAEAMGGSLELDRTVAIGTRFVVRLPR